MYELPFQRSVLRQAHPKAVFSRLNPGHGLGITAATQMPMRPIRSLSHGGMTYDDGGTIDLGGNLSDSMGSPMLSLDPYVNAGQQQPMQSTGFDPSQFSANQADTSPTGLAGWLQNKHGGIPGSNWLQAGLTALSGILSGVASKRAQTKSIGTFSGGGIMGCGGMMANGGRYMGDGNVMAGGGILSGAGDGMSDSIPANQGQIRLSQGEFVIPADVVSQIGNGDSKSGAQKIQGGIDSLRIKKYGKAKQPPKIHDGANPLLNAIR